MTSRRNASIGVTAFVIACGGSQRSPDVVVYASGTDLESANPLVTVHPLSRQIQRHVLLVTLFRYDSALNLQPYYVRRSAWADAGRELTLFLEPRLRWHDGTSTTARDVAFSLLRARDPQTGYARASDLASIDTVRARDDTTVVIRFRDRQREIPSILAELPLLPRHRLAHVEPREMRGATFNVAPLGNGPFRFVERVPGQRWVFERNANFPPSMGGPPRLKQLVVTVVDEATTKFAGLASGELDFAGIAPTMAGLATRDPLIDVMDYAVLFSTALVFNTTQPPFDDARVRRAVSLAVNRKRVVDVALAGYGTPAVGPVPPENPLATNASTPVVDAAAADRLLDESGWRRGTDGWRARGKAFEIELLTVGSSDNAIEQLLQADLAARGIRVHIRQLEMAAFLARARAFPKRFDVLITGVPGDLSLAYLRAMFHSTQHLGSLDYAEHHDGALDRLFAAAQTAPTADAQRQAWLDVQRHLDAETPVAWLYHSRGLQGVSSRMRNVVMDLRGELVSVSRWSVADDTRSAVASR